MTLKQIQNVVHLNLRKSDKNEFSTRNNFIWLQIGQGPLSFYSAK